MKKIKYWLWGFLGVLTVFWAIAVSWPEAFGLLELRSPFIHFTGVLGIGAMSFAMILALRPVWLEPWLGGLDKSYRLHKWLGITALVMAVGHWLAINAPKWATSLGLMERPQRGARPEITDLPAIQQWFNTQRDAAEMLGEWAFYAIALLIIVALVKWVPYRVFAKTHTLIAVTFFVLVYHSVVLMDFGYWTQPIGIILSVLMAASVVAGVLALTRQIGRGQQVDGTIEEIDMFPELGIIETTIQLEEGWKGHQAGQFAFVTFDSKEGAHPFTIGSAWNAEDRRINFITKSLGDYTDQMVDRLKVGGKVSVEGPYGRFIFSDSKKRQIWIGAGIGITPFIARMKQLAREPGDQVVDLYHTIAFDDPKAAAKGAADAAAADVRLHVLVDSRDGLLTGDRLRAEIPDWKEASIWFCGPAKFGQSLRADLRKNGLKENDFHQELFEMR